MVGYEILSGTYGPYTSSVVEEFTVAAPSGKRVLSGALIQSESGGAVRGVYINGYPNSDGTAWVFQVRSQGAVGEPAEGTYRVVVATYVL